MTISDALNATRKSSPPRWLEQAWAARAPAAETIVDGAMVAWRGWNLENDALPGIILVHGFQAHARWWDHIAPFLAEDHRVVAFCMSGMGDSGHRECYSHDQFARELWAIADAAGFDRPTIIAHSFGGSVALVAASLAPERVERLILIDSVLEVIGGLPARMNQESKPRLYPDHDTALSRFRLIPPGEWPDPHILLYIAGHSLRQGPDGWSWKFDDRIGSSSIRLDRPFVLPALPINYLYGEHSELISPARLEYIRQRLPCESVSTIPASHHHVMIEQPLALVAALKVILAQAAPDCHMSRDRTTSADLNGVELARPIGCLPR